MLVDFTTEELELIHKHIKDVTELSDWDTEDIAELSLRDLEGRLASIIAEGESYVG